MAWMISKFIQVAIQSGIFVIISAEMMIKEDGIIIVYAEMMMKEADSSKLFFVIPA